MDYRRILEAALEGRVGDSPLRSRAAENLSLPSLVAFERGRVRARWEVDPRFLNSRDTLYGGYYGVLFDGVAGLTAMTVLADDEQFRTGDLRISYFRPVCRGSVRFDARVVTRTRSRLHIDMLMLDADDRELAAATAVQHVIGSVAQRGDAGHGG